MIDVAFTPALLGEADLIVVIDVLRATTTATTALAAGYDSVIVAASVDLARSMRAPGRVLAGEQRCVAPDGFDQGNSPSDARVVHGTEFVLATTNGAPTVIAATARAPTVLLGALVNLDAVAAAVRARGDPAAGRIQLACSGTDGAAALEDAYAAGRLSERLTGPRTDAARIAEGLARSYPSPLDALAASADAAVLYAGGMGDDVADCAQVSMLDCVPVVAEAHGEIAIVRR